MVSNIHYKLISIKLSFNNIKYLQFDRIISNSNTYPGLHQESCPRTSDAFKPLEVKSQFQIIWRAFCEYLREKITSCKGINVKNLGAFTYEVETTLPKLGIEYNKSKTKSFKELLVEKKSTNKLRPCFVIDPKYKKILSKFKDIEEISKPKSQSSIYQKGFQMTYCNPVPIAAACYLHKNVINDSLNALFQAIYDLVNMGKNIVLKFGFVNIYFYDRNLSYNFNPEVSNSVKNVMETQTKLKRGITPVSNNWKVNSVNKWERSSLSSILDRPYTPLIKTIDNKNQLLKVMSLDMASTAKKKENNYNYNTNNNNN